VQNDTLSFQDPFSVVS
jgi:hypothetical protein